MKRLPREREQLIGGDAGALEVAGARRRGGDEDERTALVHRSEEGLDLYEVVAKVPWAAGQLSMGRGRS